MTNIYRDEAEIALMTEYDDILIGNQKKLNPYYFKGKTQWVQQKLAISVLKYACETYMRWSPEKTYISLSVDVLRKWHLIELLKYINFPEDLDRHKDLFYIAILMYPNKFKFNRAKFCMTLYERVLSGELKKFPKDYFGDSYAINKACICLKYAIEDYGIFSSVEDMYRFFSTPESHTFLRNYKIFTPIHNLFASPVTAFHLTLSNEQENNFLFQFYRMAYIYNEHQRLLSEKRGRKAVREHTQASTRADDEYVQPDF